MVTSLQSWTKVLGTVPQYSYFSVISRFPLKTVHTFPIFLAVLPPPPPYKVETRKNSAYKRATLFVGWGEGLDLCELENAPETRKCPKTFVQDCRFRIQTYCRRRYKFLGRPWPATRDTISLNRFSTISMQWRDTNKLKLKKKGKKEEEEKKILYSFTPTYLLILYCYNSGNW